MILLFLVLITSTAIFGDHYSKQDIVDSIEYSILNPKTEIDLYNNDSNKTLNYSPNTSSSFGVAVNLKRFSLGASFKDPNPENEDTENSQYSDFRIKTLISNGILEAFYFKYKGFKINQDLDNELLPITARSYGLNYTFFINPEIRISQNMCNLELKKKTEYGTFLSFAYAKNKLNSKTSLVPKGQEADFNNFVGLKSFEQDALTAIYGLAGTLSFYKFYFQASLGLGINFSKVEYKGTDLEASSNTGPAGKTYLNLGYQFKRSLFGLEANLFSSADRQGANELSLKRIDTTVYYHYFF